MGETSETVALTGKTKFGQTQIWPRPSLGKTKFGQDPNLAKTKFGQIWPNVDRITLESQSTKMQKMREEKNEKDGKQTISRKRTPSRNAVKPCLREQVARHPNSVASLSRVFVCDQVPTDLGMQRFPTTANNSNLSQRSAFPTRP